MILLMYMTWGFTGVPFPPETDEATFGGVWRPAISPTIPDQMVPSCGLYMKMSWTLGPRPTENICKRMAPGDFAHHTPPNVFIAAQGQTPNKSKQTTKNRFPVLSFLCFSFSFPICFLYACCKTVMLPSCSCPRVFLFNAFPTVFQCYFL